MRAFDQDTPNGIARVFAPDNPDLQINGRQDYVPDVAIAVLDTGVDGSHPDVLTVSSMADSDGAPGGNGGTLTCRADTDDTLSTFSNFGATIDIAAPGSCIVSTMPGGGYGTLSGTSMASPHAAGGLALLAVGQAKPTDRAGVKAMYQTLTEAGNLDWNDTSGDGVHEPLMDVGDPDIFPADGDHTPPQGPVADLTHSCDDTTLTCTFDGSGSAGEVTDHTWDLGDGTTADGASVEHTYTSTGTYTVTLTVTDDQSRTDSTSVEVAVGTPDHAAPTADFNGTCYTFLRFCEMDASGSGAGDAPITGYHWDFGDGSTGSGANTWHFYRGAGTYTITLTVTDQTGATGSVSKPVTL